MTSPTVTNTNVSDIMAVTTLAATSTTEWNMSANYTYPSGGYGMRGPSGPTWSWWLLQVSTPIVLVIGIVGNVLSFMVMKTRRLRNKSYAHYLCTLAVFDSLVLVGKYLHRLDQLLQAHGHHGLFYNFGDAGCKIHNFSMHVCYLMSSWLVLCVTVERFIAVNFPFKKDVLCRPRNAVTVILGVFVFMSYSQIFRLIVYGKSAAGHGCGVPDESHNDIYFTMHIYVYQLLLQFSIPALLIMICNVLILLKISRLRRGVTEHGTSHSIKSTTGRSKTTCMLLIISFVYLITLFPLVLISIIVHVAVKVNQPLARWLVLNLHGVGEVFECFSEFNYGTNFFVYVFSGTQFRYELKTLCCRGYAMVPNVYSEKVFRFRRTGSGGSSLRSLGSTKRTQLTLADSRRSQSPGVPCLQDRLPKATDDKHKFTIVS